MNTWVRFSMTGNSAVAVGDIICDGVVKDLSQAVRDKATNARSGINGSDFQILSILSFVLSILGSVLCEQ